MGDIIDMHRRHDHETSVDAADRVSERRTWIQNKICYELECGGPMTDGELEIMACFTGYAPSTVRKRRSELFKAGIVVATKERRNGMTVWTLARPWDVSHETVGAHP